MKIEDLTLKIQEVLSRLPDNYVPEKYDEPIFNEKGLREAIIHPILMNVLNYVPFVDIEYEHRPEGGGAYDYLLNGLILVEAKSTKELYTLVASEDNEGLYSLISKYVEDPDCITSVFILTDGLYWFIYHKDIGPNYIFDINLTDSDLLYNIYKLLIIYKTNILRKGKNRLSADFDYFIDRLIQIKDGTGKRFGYTGTAISNRNLWENPKAPSEVIRRFNEEINDRFAPKEDITEFKKGIDEGEIEPLSTYYNSTYKFLSLYNYEIEFIILKDGSLKVYTITLRGESTTRKVLTEDEKSELGKLAGEPFSTIMEFWEKMGYSKKGFRKAYFQLKKEIS